MLELKKFSPTENLVTFQRDLITVAIAHELALLGGYLAAYGGWLFPNKVTRQEINQVLSKWLQTA